MLLMFVQNADVLLKACATHSACATLPIMPRIRCLRVERFKLNLDTSVHPNWEKPVQQPRGSFPSSPCLRRNMNHEKCVQMASCVCPPSPSGYVRSWYMDKLGNMQPQHRATTPSIIFKYHGFVSINCYLKKKLHHMCKFDHELGVT